MWGEMNEFEYGMRLLWIGKQVIIV